MIVTIHQPEHLIWLGLVDKISRADVFVILDNVQFRKNYFQNRNRIRTKDGWAWLTVSLAKHPLKTNINQIEVAEKIDWQEHYLGLLKENYRQALYFNHYFTALEDVLNKKHSRLVDLNLDLLELVLNTFDVKSKTILASDLGIGGQGSELILAICQTVGADEYLGGVSAKNYLDKEQFEKAGIKIQQHQFFHPIYPQQFEPFLQGMSSIDLLFNCGEQAKEVLFSPATKRFANPVEEYFEV